MTLRIVKRSMSQATVFRMSGRIQSADLGHITELMSGIGQSIMLDLEEITLVDRDVVAFLRKCEDDGVTLLHCPAYVRKWIGGGDHGARTPDEED